MRLSVLLVLGLLGASTLSAQLIQIKLNDPEAAYLGVRTEQISNEKAERLEVDYPEGAFVTSVLPGSPAERAGLRVFDYIVQVDDRQISDRQRLKDVLRNYTPDDQLILYFIRNGEPNELAVRLNNDRFADRTAIFVKEPVYSGLRVGNSFERNGVAVRVQRNSPAQTAGLRDGDALLRVGDYRVADFEDVKRALQQYEPGDRVPLTYLREGAERTDVLRLSDTEDRLERLGERIENIFDDPIIVSRGGQSRSSDQVRLGTVVYHHDYGRCKNGGNGAYLGVYSKRPDREKREKLGFDNAYGRYVSKVVPGTPAERAGLQPFDYITGMNGQTFTETYCFSCALNEARPGDKMTLSFVRKGQVMTASTLLADRADIAQEENENNCDRPFLGVRQMHWTAPADELGVQVRIIDNTTAAGMGLQDETIIRRINDYPIVDWSDLSAAVRSTPVGNTVMLDLTTPEGKTRRERATMQSYRTYKGGECEEKEDKWSHNNWQWNGESGMWVNGKQVEEPTEVTIPDPVPAVEDMRIKVEEMPAAEAAALDMPTDNSLAVADLSLAPNPSMGMFNVSFNLPQRGDALIRIFNSAGREIYSYELNDFQGAFSDDVDITQNGPGLYFLAVTQNGQTMTRKLVLQRR